MVESFRRAKTTLELIPEDRAEDTAPKQVTFSPSDDVDAAWVKKGKKTHYGYKVHRAALMALCLEFMLTGEA